MKWVDKLKDIDSSMNDVKQNVKLDTAFGMIGIVTIFNKYVSMAKHE